MSTTGWKNYSFPWIFKDRRERTGQRKKLAALPNINPYLQMI